jgi:hypothetical protein
MLEIRESVATLHPRTRGDGGHILTVVDQSGVHVFTYTGVLDVQRSCEAAEYLMEWMYLGK